MIAAEAPSEEPKVKRNRSVPIVGEVDENVAHLLLGIERLVTTFEASVPQLRSHGCAVCGVHCAAKGFASCCKT